MRLVELGTIAVLLLGGCKAFPEIAEFSCGNGVVEAGEDCDAFGRNQPGCRAAGQPGACHFDCTRTGAGEPSDCPVGFGCDATNVCRRVSGGYGQAEVTLPGAAVSLLASDFDGNGGADILSLEEHSIFGLARPTIDFFDGTGAPAGRWSTTKLIASPSTVEVSGDQRSDLVCSTFASLAILLGQQDQSLITAITPSFFLANNEVRLIPVADVPVDKTTQVVIMTGSEGHYGLGVTSSDDPSLRNIATLEHAIDELSGAPATANVDEDDERAPCLDIVLGYRGAAELRLYQPCTWDAGGIVWREKAVETEVGFEPPSTVAGPPLLADLDGDGHVDLFVMSADGPYAAFGDGRTLGKLTPYGLTVTGEHPMPGEPIAAGDLTGDGIADFVDRTTLLIAVPQTNGTLTYHSTQRARVPPWSDARMADFTGDGQLDAVAVSDGVADMEFFMGTGTDRPNPFVIPTRGPPDKLSIGDFDGDTLPDLAYAAELSDDSGLDEIAVSFGQYRGPLGPSIPVARLANIEQIVAASEHAYNTVADILITHELEGPDGSGTAVSLVAGSGDRQLLAPVLLNNYAADGSLETFNTVLLSVGSFTEPSSAEVAAVAVPDRPADEEQAEVDQDLSVPFNLWLIPDLRQGDRAPQLLEANLDPRFLPIWHPVTAHELVARLVAGDIDGDNLDELIVASPLRDATICLLQLGKLSRQDARFDVRQLLELDLGCEAEPPLRIEDVDGDGAADLVLLAGLGESQHLLVLWNDGTGGFSPEHRTSVLSDAASPRAFSFLRGPKDVLRLAIVTQDELRVLESRGKARTFKDLPIGRALTNGTGVVAADVDGDGVTDLAIADDGAVRVLHASLEGQ